MFKLTNTSMHIFRAILFFFLVGLNIGITYAYNIYLPTNDGINISNEFLCWEKSLTQYNNSMYLYNPLSLHVDNEEFIQIVDYYDKVVPRSVSPYYESIIPASPNQRNSYTVFWSSTKKNYDNTNITWSTSPDDRYYWMYQDNLYSSTGLNYWQVFNVSGEPLNTLGTGQISLHLQGADTQQAWSNYSYLQGESSVMICVQGGNGLWNSLVLDSENLALLNKDKSNNEYFWETPVFLYGTWDSENNVMVLSDTSSPCGDGVIQSNIEYQGEPYSEECDDGNTINGDGCSSSCTWEEAVCGDSIRQHTEQCDDGNDDNFYCGTDCVLIESNCGDGHIQYTEQCDDANTNENDYCFSDCTINAQGVLSSVNIFAFNNNSYITNSVDMSFDLVNYTDNRFEPLTSPSAIDISDDIFYTINYKDPLKRIENISVFALNNCSKKTFPFMFVNTFSDSLYYNVTWDWSDISRFYNNSNATSTSVSSPHFSLRDLYTYNRFHQYYSDVCDYDILVQVTMIDNSVYYEKVHTFTPTEAYTPALGIWQFDLNFQESFDEFLPDNEFIRIPIQITSRLFLWTFSGLMNVHTMIIDSVYFFREIDDFLLPPNDAILVQPTTLFGRTVNTTPDILAGGVTVQWDSVENANNTDYRLWFHYFIIISFVWIASFTIFNTFLKK